MTYSDKLRDPRWREIRDRVLTRDKHRCQVCGIGAIGFRGENVILNVHHRCYHPNKEPWEYEIQSLITVCETCHEPGDAPNLNKIINNMEKIRAMGEKITKISQQEETLKANRKKCLIKIARLGKQNVQLYDNIIGKDL